MKLYGLIGYPLAHSWSAQYFADKFKRENITGCRYKLFPIEKAQELLKLIRKESDLCGLNVTIPFKREVTEFMDKIDGDAGLCGAVNCIAIERTSSKTILTGFNTDVPAFRQSITPYLKPVHKNALILGTGGVAVAVALVLERLGISFRFVSRNPPGANQLSYSKLNRELMLEHTVIINCTPLGTFPATTTCPPIPYEFLTKDHLLFDLTYNPEETLFLKKGKQMGTVVKNGLEMLHLQAEISWGIWNP